MESNCISQMLVGKTLNRSLEGIDQLIFDHFLLNSAHFGQTKSRKPLLPSALVELSERQLKDCYHLVGDGGQKKGC